MRQVLAVALLDFRRLGFGLAAMALVFGLVPSLASGLDVTVPVTSVLVFSFLIVGSATGGSFGSDFAEGKGSFFFARPLRAGVLIAGRFLAFVALTVTVFTAVMASNWISTSEGSRWGISVLTVHHLHALTISWSLSLYFSLGIAAQVREQRSKWGLRQFALAPFRLVFGLLATLVPFGLFADLMFRAYSTPAPAKVLFESFILAACACSCLAIVAGRSDRLRIRRFLNRGMTTYAAVAISIVCAAWTYVLHPGARAVERVLYAQASPDGSTAYVRTQVNRGDSNRFWPTFAVQIATGEARQLNADPGQVWTSADGGTLVWSEATPFFFRPLWWSVTERTSYRVRLSSGDVQPFPVPRKLPGGLSGPTRLWGDIITRVIPAKDGDVFATELNRHLTFTSRSRGEMSDLELGADSLITASFLPSGQLRAAMSSGRQSAHLIAFKDIDPSTGQAKVIATLATGNNAQVRFDRRLTRALVMSQPRAGRTTITLVEIGQDPGFLKSTVLLAEAVNPNATFLADGRVAAMSGGAAHGALKIFSETGVQVLEIEVPDRSATLESAEMFPGILALRVSDGPSGLVLLDSSSGVTLRRLQGASVLPQPDNKPPVGSPAARLVLLEGRLYELPSPTAELRLLLPLPKG